MIKELSEKLHNCEYLNNVHLDEFKWFATEKERFIKELEARRDNENT